MDALICANIFTVYTYVKSPHCTLNVSALFVSDNLDKGRKNLFLICQGDF